MSPQSTQRGRQREGDFTAEHAEDAERKAEQGRGKKEIDERRIVKRCKHGENTISWFSLFARSSSLCALW